MNKNDVIQHFHRGLKQANHGKGIDKFLTSNFIQYLEVAGMVYPEISLTGLRDMGKREEI